MRSRILAIGICVFVCAAWAPYAEAQWGRGGGGGMGRGGQGGENRARFEEARTRMEAMNALNLEAMWAVLSFGVKLAPEKLDPLRGPFAEMWSKRSSILEDAEKGGKTDWGAIKDEFKEMKKDLDQRIKTTLDEESHKSFSRQMKAYDRSIPQFQGGGWGPPGGGFGPQGGRFRNPGTGSGAPEEE